eukprot:CAMPEP_0185415486 /NCGR_PEP_ID=MMETSP1365-20130426/6541_1 /TAXON_ID=38817 /ORGANISM="Gephyrocapsa oceanica, Strain RCC1303" /LENGTH=69 /DNA_ID=CAMNT_0028018589 /DNA_START=60 /DNA_END=265 /DNA_ORIENTATION=+
MSVLFLCASTCGPRVARGGPQAEAGRGKGAGGGRAAAPDSAIQGRHRDMGEVWRRHRIARLGRPPGARL